ncbi:MAG: hypothetical protein A4E33_00030 [Methanoregula sp. PtaB.Bin085]|nr:MAG: hypothetical protein A4E33_00030 [Methanoregula sp. PtaB.Bin085]
MYSKPMGITSEAKPNPFLPGGFTSKILLNAIQSLFSYKLLELVRITVINLPGLKL